MINRIVRVKIYIDNLRALTACRERNRFLRDVEKGKGTDRQTDSRRLGDTRRRLD